MVRQTRSAERQIDALVGHFIGDKKFRAAQKLRDAVAEAAQRIESNPKDGLPHPKPYPKMARWGFLWIHVHRYWIGWSMAKGYPVITNVHWDESRMWRRVAPDEEEDSPI